MGVRLASEPRYGGGGHPAISEDASGNVIIASGKQILGVLNGPANPLLAQQGFPTAGIYGSGNTTYFTATGSARFSSNQLTNTSIAALSVSQDFEVAVGKKLTAGGPVACGPGPDQVIDAAGDTIVADRAHVKVAPDVAHTLTSVPTIAAATDGQHLRIENVGPGELTLQDEAVLAGTRLKVNGETNVIIGVGEMVLFVYSTDAGAAGAWVMAQNRVNT